MPHLSRQHQTTCASDGQRTPLGLMTRAQVNDPRAQNLRPLIDELTTPALP
jgi:hypothetical protein